MMTGPLENYDLLKIRSVKTPSLFERSEKSLCKCWIVPSMAMTVGMIMVLPSSHSLKQWGRLCQNGSWGEIPVRWRAGHRLTTSQALACTRGVEDK